MNTDETDPLEILFAEYTRAGGYGRDLQALQGRTQMPKKAVDVLSRWLQNLEELWPEPDSEMRSTTRIVIIRALGIRDARGTSATSALISQFDLNKNISDHERWTAGNSLYEIPADADWFERLVAIATNPEYGYSRQMVVNWLFKSKRWDEAIPVAVSQLAYPEVQGHALDALARMRAKGIRDQIEPFLDSSNKWHRRSAEKILRYSEG